MATAIIDRFEGELAVLEVDGSQRVVRRSQLPADAHEGDAIDLETMRVDRAETDALQDRVAAARARAKKKPFRGGSL